MSDAVFPERWWRRTLLWPGTDPGLPLTLLALAALLIGLFPQVIFFGEVFFGRDVLIVWVAQVEAFVRSIRSGSWPVWDPGVAFGQPMLGNPNTQVFYPFTWLNLLIQPLTLYVLYVFAHLLLAGAGFHLWARRLGLSAGAAMLGACVWVGSGPLLSLVNVWHHLAGASWLPWVMWAAEPALSEGRRRQLIGLAALLAVQIYAGSPDLCVFTGLLLGADGLRRLSLPPRRWRPLARLIGAYLMALGLGAAQLAPSMDLALHSGSRPLSVEARTLWSLHPAALVQTLLPLSFKDLPPLAPQLVQPLFDLWSPFVQSNYLGLASVVFVVWAFLGQSRRAALCFALLAAASLTLALGKYSVPYSVLAAVAPPVTMVRYPSKFVIIAALAWAMLVAHGYEAWRRGPELSSRRRLGLAAFALLLAAGLAAMAAGFRFFPGTLRLPMEGPAWTTILSLARANVTVAAAVAGVVALVCCYLKPAGRAARLAPLLVVAELAFSNRTINPTAETARLNQPPEILSVIPRDPPARVYVWDYVLRAPGRGHPTSGMLGVFMEVAMLPDPAIGGLAFQAYLYPPSAARWGLRGSFDRDLLGLYPPWLNEANLLLREVEDTQGYLQLLQLGGVARVVAIHRDMEGLPLLKEVPGIFRRPIQVFEVRDPWPRTYVVCRTRTAPGIQALHTLLAPDFDGNREVVVDQEVRLPGACRSGVSRVVEDRPDRVTLEAVLDGSGVVTLLDGAAPGWQVFVDEVPSTLLRVNHIFRGVKLSAGRHLIRFVYRPASIRWGAAASMLTALAVALLASRSRG